MVNSLTTKEPIIHSGVKGSLFNPWCWEKWTMTCKRIKLNHYLTPYAIINSKQTKDLNLRPITIKLLDEHTGGKPPDVNHGDDFLDLIPKAKTTKAKANTWDGIN